MKAVKAGLGYQTIGGTNYANVGGELKELSQEDERAIRNAPASQAQALKDAYVTKLAGPDSGSQMNRGGQANPANTQNPVVAPTDNSEFGNVSFQRAMTTDSMTGNQYQEGDQVNFNQPMVNPFEKRRDLGIIDANSFQANNSYWGQ